MSFIRQALNGTVVVGILGLLAVNVVLASTSTVAPRGKFSQIDTRLATESIQILSGGTAAQKRALIARIQSTPEDYAPPVFYVLSNVRFADGDKDEGAFWFYAGQLRARIDANICADSTARQAVGVLNKNFGAPINRYSFQDLTKLEALVLEVVEWERTTPYNYDRHWINLHGMRAVRSGLGGQSEGEAQQTLSYPRDQWDEIAEKTRNDYVSAFRKEMARIKNKE